MKFSYWRTQIFYRGVLLTSTNNLLCFDGFPLDVLENSIFYGDFLLDANKPYVVMKASYWTRGKNTFDMKASWDVD